MNPNVDYDELGEVINGPQTILATAQHLHHGGTALIGWTDQEGTHLDILLSYKAVRAGTVMRGIRSGDLFVSIMGLSAFGFDISRPDTHYTYYGEKLKLGANVTSEQLAILLNGIKKLLHEAATTPPPIDLSEFGGEE